MSHSLIEILSFLSCPDLASTSRVSQRFRSASQPLLYRTHCFLKTRVTRSTRSSLELLLLTLTAPGNETLATSVRSLTFEAITILEVIRRPRVHLAVLMAAVTNLDRLLPFAGQNATFIFLLYLLPSLKVLHIRRPPLNFFRSLPYHITPGPRALLKSLCEFHCSHSNSYLMPATVFIALLQLPSLDYIDVRINRRLVHPSYRLEHVPRSSHVTKMRLANNNLWFTDLSRILSIPTALTHFSYTVATADTVDIPRFMASLAPVRTTLQYLHLDLGHIKQATDRDTIPLLGESLREWSALRTLTCPLLALLGSSSTRTLADVLPLGLRELAVVASSDWPYGEMVAQVVALLELKMIRVPVLEKVAVVNVGAVVDEVEFARGILDVACQRAGVQCVKKAFRWYL